MLKSLTWAGASGLAGLSAHLLAAEPPPETTRIRLVRESSICLAPLYIAEELLKAEGFGDVQYVPVEGDLAPGEMLGAGKADIGSDAVPALILNLEAGEPIVVFGGVHSGCYELFGTERVRTIRDLKGKKVAVSDLRKDRHAFVAAMAVHVGLDPLKDIDWVVHPAEQAVRLLKQGRVDAFLGFPPEPQELRAKKIGHVVVNTTVDRPWSQYFCCMAAANRGFASKYPVATRRALRALLKAADLCASEPERVARFLLERKYTAQYEYALQTLREVPYTQWREFVPEDSVRFYALRLHEGGMIKTSPQKLIAQGTDWRFFNQLKKELKT
ncbi:MAG: ABC transporter substrate-binding protein [Betaproteobacteria bacterium]|nr:ABC transporter substrate-binding protein [Betaproteobacteria bacterium]